MKFQNPILNLQWMHARTDKPKAICPFNFFKVVGIMIFAANFWWCFKGLTLVLLNKILWYIHFCFPVISVA